MNMNIVLSYLLVKWFEIKSCCDRSESSGKYDTMWPLLRQQKHSNIHIKRIFCAVCSVLYVRALHFMMKCILFYLNSCFCLHAQRSKETTRIEPHTEMQDKVLVLVLLLFFVFCFCCVENGRSIFATKCAQRSIRPLFDLPLPLPLSSLFRISPHNT